MVTSALLVLQVHKALTVVNETMVITKRDCGKVKASRDILVVLNSCIFLATFGAVFEMGQACQPDILNSISTE